MGNLLRETLHFVLVMISFVAWTIGNCSYAVVAALSFCSQKVHPNSRYNNCWTWSFPYWMKYGGYMAMRAADGQRFLGIFPVPHVLWIAELPTKGVKVRQWIPVPAKRKSTNVVPWYVVLYDGEIRKAEVPHNATSGWEESV